MADIATESAPTVGGTPPTPSSTTGSGAKAVEKLPTEVEQKLKRGRDGLAEVQARRQLAIRFANGHHFGELNEGDKRVVDLSVISGALGGEKPDHRVRRSHDILGPMLKKKISALTQREPDWESTSGGGAPDVEDYGASRLALKIATAGYDLWDFPIAEAKALWFALVTEETFGRVSWNSNVGPFEDVSQHPEADFVDAEGNKPYVGMPDAENPIYRGRGEVAVTIYSGLEVLWEPGVDFENSRWCAIEHARSIEEIENEPGFLKAATEGKLKPDAATASTGRSTNSQKKGTNLCIVTEYFERPSPKYPQGRWGTYANGRKIFPDADYPIEDNEGRVVDTQCLRRLSWALDASNDRARGLVQQLFDEVRAYDQAINKQSEYSQIGLVPQMSAPEGVIITDPSDEPGLIIEYDRTLAGGERPEWRENIPLPSELFTMEERALQRFQEIAQDEIIPPGVRSAQAFQIISELSRASWQKFAYDFNRFRSNLMSDCLVLVQRKYGADRVLKFRGATGWELVSDFEGADIRDQTDVKVRSNAAEAQTRAQTETQIMQLVQTFPGVFPPEVVIEALNSATPEKLIQGYEEDVGRAHRIIEQLRAGTFWDQPLRPALPGEEVLEEVNGRPMVPGWLPRPFDSLPILKSAMENWMKTDDWEFGPAQTKDASLFYYQKLIDLETQAEARKQEVQNRIAEEQGAANAAKPSVKPMPSLPGGGPQIGGGNGEELPSPNSGE